MKVWVVRSGCVHEGGGVHYVCATIELAEKRAREVLVEDYDCDFDQEPKRREEDYVVWRYKSEFVSCTLWEVEDE